MPYKYLYAGYTYFVLPVLIPVLPFGLRLYTLIKRMALKYYFAEKKLHYWRQNKQLLLSLVDSGYKTTIQQLGLDLDKITLSENSRRQSNKVVLGEIDQDGFLLSNVGNIPNVPNTSHKQFLARKRFGLRAVVIDGSRSCHGKSTALRTRISLAVSIGAPPPTAICFNLLSLLDQ